MVCILQWNARSLVANGQEFKKFIKDLEDKPDLLCVQETWLKPCLDYSIPGYVCFRKDRIDRPGGGCATFVKIGLQYKLCECNVSLENLITEVWTTEGKLVIVNCYNPCKPLVLLELEEMMSKTGSSAIWVGDFNAHSPLWGSQDMDSNGKVIEELLDRGNLIILNDNSPTRFDVNTNRTSCLDLTFATPALARIAEWKVMNKDAIGSDHFPVVSTFKRALVTNQSDRMARFDYSRADWNKFREVTIAGLDIINSDGSIEEMCESLTAMIINGASESIPCRRCPRERIIVPWWNKKCDQAIGKRKQAFRTLRKNPTEKNLIEFKKCRALARKIIKSEKKKSWRTYCGTINHNTPVKQVWSRIHKMSGKTFNLSFPVLKNGSSEAVFSKDKADMCAKVFQDVHNSKSLSEESLRLRENILQMEGWKLINSAETIKDYNKYFSIKELKDAIQAGANTSPGQDGISYKLLQHLDDIVLDEICVLCNYIWEAGTIPKVWKHAVVLPILKPGKDPSSPSSYRPIALTAVLCKVMERMVTNRLVYFLEISGFLVNYQNGFRIGRNTMDSVSVLDQDIRRAIINKEAVVAVFLDIEKAYDSMWREGLLIKLFNAGISGRMFLWIKDFLSNRTIQVRVENELSDLVSIANGTPQGSVISPVLFNVMINDIFSDINVRFGRSLFADDGAIWRRGKNVEFLMKQTQIALNQIVQWANRWGFKISTSKSSFMIFGFKRKIPDLNLKIYECDLEKVKVFKFLGIWMDEKLTWGIHIEKIIARCEKINNILRSLAGSDWGAERLTLHMIYRAMIRPILDYGSFVFGAARKTALTKIDIIQAKALRICSGAFKTTPIPALLVEMNETPLNIRRKKLGLQYWARLKGLMYNSTAKSLLEEYYEFVNKKDKSNFLFEIQQIAKKAVQGTEVIGSVWSPVPVWLLPEPEVDLCFLGLDKTKASKQISKDISQNLDQICYIFTDGSKDPRSGRAGFGVYVMSHQIKQSIRITDCSSVYSSELAAIWWALEWVQENKPISSHIYSDSAAALQALRGGLSGGARPDLVVKILCCLYRVELDGCSVKFSWIPGHSDILGNEMADNLAKESLTRNGIDRYIPLGKFEYISIFKIIIEQQWQREWEKEKRGRHYFSCQPLIKNSRVSLSTCRQDQVKLTRLRLGHCGLADCLKVISKHPDGLCACGESENVTHVLMRCPRYLGERQTLFRTLSELGITVFSFKTIFSEGPNSASIDKAVVKFLHGTGLYFKI